MYRPPAVQPSAPKMEEAPSIHFEGHNVRYRPNKELSKKYLQEKYGLMSMEDIYTITDSMDLWNKTPAKAQRKSWSPEDNNKSWSMVTSKSTEQVRADTKTVPASMTGHDVNVEAEVNTSSPSKVDNERTFKPGHKTKDQKATSIYPSLRQELQTNQ